MREHVYTPTEAAALAGTTAGNLDSWSARLGFPVARYWGKRKYFSRTEVHAWLQSSDRATPTATPVGESHHHAYPKEFVAEALRLRMQGVGLGTIANRLGVHKATVQHWVNGDRRVIAPEDRKIRGRT